MGYLDELIEQERDPLPYLGAAGTAAALGYGAYRTAPYYKAKGDDLGTWVQALDNESPDLQILNGVYGWVDPSIKPRVVRMLYDPPRNGVESGDGSRWRTAIHSRKPSFSVEITNSGHLDSAGRKAPFAAGGSLPTKDLDSWGEALKAKMHEDATVFGRTLDPADVDSAVDSLIDRHRKNIFRRAASLAEDVSDLPGRIVKTLFKTSQDKSINPYLKLAYDHGAQQALADAGLSKLASFGIDDITRKLKTAPYDLSIPLKKLLRAHGDSRAPDLTILEKPMSYLERAALGGLAGGAAGGLASDEDNTLRGVALGAALGASAGGLSGLTSKKIYGKDTLDTLDTLDDIDNFYDPDPEDLEYFKELADSLPLNRMLASAALTGAGTLGAGILGGRLSNED